MKLKESPEDFIVKEIFPIEGILEKGGNYHIYLLSKTNRSTPEAISRLSRILNLPESSFGYAGNKDKRARTEQYISIKGKKARDIDDANLKIEYKGSLHEPISLGDHEGNQFEITIREITPEEHKVFLKNTRNATIVFPNVFGEQRFSNDNAEIGKCIVKQEFSKAVTLLLKHKGSYEKKMREHFETQPSDAIGCLRKMPSKILRLFIHAYQSKLFNELLKDSIKRDPTEEASIKPKSMENKPKKEKLIEHMPKKCRSIENKSKSKNVKNKKLPLIGFGTNESLINPILKKENLTTRDFIIPQLPELSSEGTERNAFETCTGFKILHDSKETVKLEFSLPKGAYATVLIRYLFS
ncbi:MAG TPA: tRNA pseudouridine(13) synthase TruD [Candidatus Nanoarchaeia archaeon]|nr:tRNA pseudouridine(13) synthase TruD [Candidatus Nanoarchaeia archaeon]